MNGSSWVGYLRKLMLEIVIMQLMITVVDFVFSCVVMGIV